MSTDSVFSEDEDIKVRKRLERQEKIENDPISTQGLDSLLEKTGLSLEELKEIQEIFQLVDSDHSGAISPDELLVLMNTLGIKSNQVEIDNMISECDPDNTGEIDFESFVGTVSKKVKASFTYSEMIKAFKKYFICRINHRFQKPDETTEGKLPVNVLIDLLSNWGTREKRLKRDEAIELIDLVSSEKQGDLFDFHQFLSVYFE